MHASALQPTAVRARPFGATPEIDGLFALQSIL
jgi:hypothetical protein